MELIKSNKFNCDNINILFKSILGFFLLISSVVFSQTIKVIDNKGTIREVESSKWTTSGDDIYNKNTANVGIGTTTPHPTAKLDVNSTTGGLLLPRLTTLQRDAILSPAVGLIIFNTTNNGLEVNTGTETSAVWTSFLPIGGGTMNGDIHGTILTLNNNGGNNATTIGAGTTTGPVTIGGSGDQSIDLGSGDGIKTVTVGSITGTSSTTFRSGTEAMTFTPAATGKIVMGNTAGTGIITLGSSSMAQTTNVGTGTGNSTVNIATGTGVNNVIVGGEGGASATTIQAGTGSLKIKSGNSPIIFSTNGTEAMRVLSDGTLCFGTTAASKFKSRIMFAHKGGVDNGLIVQNLNTKGSYALVTLNSSGKIIGGVTVTSTGTGFATTSDYRLKKDFKDFDGLSLVNKIKMYDYAWKSDGSRMYGVKAHELKDVIPYTVFGEKDELDEDGKPKYQTVDYGKLTPVLIKAVQEQQVQINELKAQVQELINKLK